MNTSIYLVYYGSFELSTMVRYHRYRIVSDLAYGNRFHLTFKIPSSTTSFAAEVYASDIGFKDQEKEDLRCKYLQ